MMKVLLINGSPRKQGCTYTALCEVAATLNECGIDTEIVQGGAVGQDCTGCGACRTYGKCVYDNDLVNELVEKAKTADGFVFGSPVYYASASGALRCLMDRCFYSGGAAFAYKPAAAVVSARRGGCTNAFDQINKYFTINNMPVVPSQYWNMVHGAQAEEVKQDEEGMQTMRTLGKNMAWLLRCIEAGKAAGIDRPAPEQKLRTNFIR